MKLDHVGRRVNDATHSNTVVDELRRAIVGTPREDGEPIRDVGITTLHTIPASHLKGAFVLDFGLNC
jgi:hypothetical protein